MGNVAQFAGILQNVMGEEATRGKTKETIGKALPMVADLVGKAFSESPKPQEQKPRSPEEEKRLAVKKEFQTEEHQKPSAKEKEESAIPSVLVTAAKVATAPVAAYVGIEGAGIALYIASCAAILRGVAAFYTSGLSETIIPGLTKKLTELGDKLKNELPGPAKQILEKTKAYDYIKNMANVDLAGLKDCLGNIPDLIKGNKFFEEGNPSNKDLLSFDSFSNFLKNAKLTEEGKTALNTAMNKFKEKVPSPEMAGKEELRPE